MNPTLVEPLALEIVPYTQAADIRPGDVVFFQALGGDHAVVHRVLRRAPGGFVTRGDNNANDDRELLQAAHIVGRVVAGQRGSQRIAVHGGRRGLAWHYFLRLERRAERLAARVLGPSYRALGRSGLLAPVLPWRSAPQVVEFQIRGQRVLRLISAGRVIGEYDDRQRRWNIRRPYRLFIDESRLPVAKKNINIDEEDI